MGWGGWRRRGRAAGGAAAPGPAGKVLEPKGAVARIPTTSRGEWELGPGGQSRAQPSAGPRRGRGRGPAPAARPFPSPPPSPKRSGAGPDPPAQEGCRADSSSPGSSPPAASPPRPGAEDTRLRAESGAAPPPFAPTQAGFPGARHPRNREPGLRCSQTRGAGPRAAAAPRGRSGQSRGSRARGAPCTPRALRCSGRSRRSLPSRPLAAAAAAGGASASSSAASPPARRSGLGSQRRAAASAPTPPRPPPRRPAGILRLAS